MDFAAERNFGLVRGATSAHIRRDLEARSDNEPGQKSLSPKGFAQNGPPTRRDEGKYPSWVFD